MNKKRIAFILAMTISVGTLSAFPVGVSAEIDMTQLPEPISAEKNTNEIRTFNRSKPKLTLNSDSYWGSYLEWTPVENALLYYVYRVGNGGKYIKIASTYDEFFNLDYADSRVTYAVQAVTYDYNDNIYYSSTSNHVTCKYSPRTYGQEESVESVAGAEIDYEGGALDDYCYIEEEISYEPIESVAVTLNSEEYSHAEESAFKNTSTDPVSTFSADVDTASYANLRRLINEKRTIPEDAVRIEEMLNYFDYNYVQPKGKSPFSVTYELSDCPWNKDSKLMMIGIQGKDIAAEDTPASNLVFLVDTSGSMWDDNKLPLVKESINMLTETLTENDRISIVTYAGDEHVVLAGAKGNQTRTVKAMTECMDAGGSTNGEGGIRAAYDIAEHYFIEGGNNRVILATDGDLNVGISDTDELVELISEKRKTGIYLTALGFGEDNLKDEKLEALADNGRGRDDDIDGAKEIIDAGDDPELTELARLELEENKQKLQETEEQLKILLLPKDPDDDKNVIIEIRGGAGGERGAPRPRLRRHVAALRYGRARAPRAAARRLRHRLQLRYEQGMSALDAHERHLGLGRVLYLLYQQSPDRDV